LAILAPYSGRRELENFEKLYFNPWLPIRKCLATVSAYRVRSVERFAEDAHSVVSEQHENYMIYNYQFHPPRNEVLHHPHGVNK
jgi:hypothetical protein